MSRTEPTSGQIAIAALLAGGVAGIVAGIPQVAMAGCLFIILGGFGAGFLLQKRIKGGITVGEGILVGAIAGVVASLAVFVMSRLVFAGAFESMRAQALERVQNLPESSRQMGQRIADLMTGPIGVVGNAIGAALISLLGGLIAALIWRAPKQGVQ